MDHRIFRLFFLLCSLFFLPLHAQASLFSQPANPQFVPVDQAFDFDFQQQGPNLSLNWKIREGYYLYRDKIELVGDKAELAAFILPKGLEHHDEFFGNTQVYEKQLNLSVPLRQASAQASLKVSYQGCAVAGFCYPPETRIIPLSAVSGEASDAATPPTPQPKPIEAAPTPQATPLPFSPLWALLIGMGIAF